MFKEYINMESYHARFCWREPNGHFHEENFPLTNDSFNKLKKQ